MKDAGVDDGDRLVIDKSLNYKSGALALCFTNREFTLKGIKVEVLDQFYTFIQSFGSTPFAPQVSQ